MVQYFYTVQPGDTLTGIANRWGLPVESLIAASSLNAPFIIYPGQQLSMPRGVDVYRVRPGDSIYHISQLYRVPTSVIIEANQLQAPYVIQAGELVKVPPGFGYYIVQPGDTLYQLAGRFNIRTDGLRHPTLIQQVNQLPSTNIYPGMNLIIPYAPPGGGGLIAYVSNISGTYDIWLTNPGNGANWKVTNGLSESFSIPVWSRDSSKIAFVGKNRNLYIVDVQSGSTAVIDQLEENDSLTLDWSPDSRAIAYSTRDQIILYDVISHQSYSIPQPGANDVQWFPNGNELLFQAADEDGSSQLYIISKDGSEKRQLTNNTAGALHNVRLSPNGLFVLYTTPGVSISIIHTIDIATGNDYTVEGGPLAKNYYPVWSPYSRLIAFSASILDTLGYFSQIRTVGRYGENERIHAISNCYATPVTWSPEGTKLAYLSGCAEQEYAREIWVIDLRHPVPVKLVTGALITSLQWSPSAVVRLPRRTYTNQVYRIRLKYPAHWEKINEERYESTDGFFQIGAISSAGSLEQVCRQEAFHQLKPYGSQPQIIHLDISNQEACFILPSADQPAEMNQQAALIVTYPTSVEIGGTSYNYFILWSDVQHIHEIASTLEFV